MKKITKMVQVNTGDAEMVIYHEDVNLAIEKGWESLYFSDNEVTFAWVTDGNKSVTLTTRGEVKVLRDNSLLKNDNVEEIRELLDSGFDIYKNDAVQSNNWFSIELETIDNHGKWNVTDEHPFESMPKSIDELEVLLVEIFNQYY